MGVGPGSPSGPRRPKRGTFPAFRAAKVRTPYEAIGTHNRMKLSEPTTAITDYLLAVELLVLGSLLAGSSSHMPVRLLAASFLTMALAAIAGGTFHARRFVLDTSSLQALWNAVRIGIVLSFGLLVAAGAMSAPDVLGSPAGTWLLAGSLVTSGAIAIQRSRIRIHRHFNHNDMFHVAMMAGYYFLYRGGLLLRDR